MIVYRCENSTQKGPYWTHGPYVDERFELLEHHNDGGQWPTPRLDNIKNFPMSPGEWHCGFISLSQMKRWFTKLERERLRSYGWKFYKLEVSGEVRKGEYQCIFHRKDAKIIEEITE